MVGSNSKQKRKILGVMIIVAIIIGTGFGLYLWINKGPTKSFYENDLPESRMIRIGSSITPGSISQAQANIINNEYHVVKTSTLRTEVRNAVKNPDLLLYRSIQGTWTDFDHLNWSHIDAHENMFCHHSGERIITVWNSWLMNASDFVDPESPDALNHWVNYLAVTASQQVHSYDYDGLFIDSASHNLGSYAVKGVMPDGYDDSAWQQARYNSLIYIKSLLPNKSVIFNGLHGECGAEDSLRNTDGGMWEIFGFASLSGQYHGESDWLKVIQLTERNYDDREISLVSKKPGMTSDISARTFIVSSYFLVWSENVYLTLVDSNINLNGELLYYPEYRLNLGNPLGNYSVNNDVYYREFEHGLVLVNPSETESLTYTLDGQYQKVIPQGGGLIQTNGNWEGSLEYETVSGTIELGPISGAILLNSNSTQSVMHPTDNIDQLRSSRTCDAINPPLFFSHDRAPIPNEIVSLNEVKISTRLRTLVASRIRDIGAY